jgi:branched-subunit amino acid aminotransferase/4-amino-4-deoxychorismate lyase
MANLFLVRGDTLLTPALESGCRAGITREAVLEIAHEEGLSTREESLDPALLFEADEVFFTSSRVECLPIAAVDGRAVGRGGYDSERSPRTAALRARLRALVAAERTRAGGSARAPRGGST